MPSAARENPNLCPVHSLTDEKGIWMDILDDYCKRFNNWGRWGPDELGTLNFITPERITRAAALVRQGRVISMALPYDSRGPQVGSTGRVNPIRVMLATGADHAAGVQGGGRLPARFGYADDAIYMPLQCGTQWDALSHIFDQGKMYNGYDASLVTAAGAQKNSIDKIATKVVTRGVLLDVARMKGEKSLAPGYAITVEDLEATAQAEGVRVESGDIVIVRTGFMDHCLQNGWGTYAGGDAPGLSLHTAPWLYENEIAGVATDTWGVEVRPNELPDVFQPLHTVALVNMGMLVGEIFSLGAIAEDCASDGVYEFMFVAPPLPITGSVGSPHNPLAIK
jgi:kynurenine formamidase